ncbi:hypothetical protein LCGC14_2065070, partial [marine sediment metagenome]
MRTINTRSGISISYQASGDLAAPVIILIMGLGAQLTVWPDELYYGLVNNGFRVIRFDNRDTGLSSQLEQLGNPNLFKVWLTKRLPVASHIPYTLDDMANGINVRRKDVARCYRLIFRELELKIPVPDPKKGVSRIASLADLSEKTKRKAIEILEKAKKEFEEKGFEGREIDKAMETVYLIDIDNLKKQIIEIKAGREDERLKQVVKIQLFKNKRKKWHFN